MAHPIDLSTNYLGLQLKNPLVASASPLSKTVSNVQHLQEAGISAVVMFSLFEEQIIHESQEIDYHARFGTDSYAEALSFYPEPSEYILTPNEYLKHIEKLRKVLNVPLIGSLNGVSTGGWTKYARYMQDAGVDALELNIYMIPTDLQSSADQIETMYLDIFQSVKDHVDIPVAVKLSPYFSSMPSMAKKLDDAGADGLVLFNRFYQPDIDLNELEVTSNVLLSTQQDMRLPMRWIAILYDHLRCDLAATSGISSATDVIKMLMVGADVTMLCSTLLRNGPDHVRDLLIDIEEWMVEKEYDSIDLMKGSMSQRSCPNPEAFERANYIKSLESYVYQ